MKKIFSILGLSLSLLLLAGCADKTVTNKNSDPIATEFQPANENLATAPLPESVSVQPGATVDEEVGNIEKDLQSVDDNSLNQGLSDAELGL